VNQTRVGLFCSAAISLGAAASGAQAETKAGAASVEAHMAATDLAHEARPAVDEEAETGAATSDAIVVTTTAQKRFENLQRVPLAVQVITPAELNAHGVRHFQELPKVSPSLFIRGAKKPINANVSIRGVGTMAYSVGVESSAAVTVDGPAVAFIGVGQGIGLLLERA
jgi:iron complex outermembrane receptor protein